MNDMPTNISDSSSQSWRARRDKFDTIRNRLNLLDGKEKIIMTMYIEKGNSIRQIARLMGISEARITRKIQRLTHNLAEGKYIACLKKRRNFSLREMSIARDYFLKGLSIKQIANKHNWSFYRVRQKLQEIQYTLKYDR